MRPPERKKHEYEKVVCNEMITGIIEQVQYDNEHKFKGFSGGEDTIQPAVRIKLKLDGYKFPKFSRWMKFNTGEKSNLYKKYIIKLIEGAKPDMDFDLDALNGLPIKVIFTEDGEYQNIDSIFPVGKKVMPDAVIEKELDTDNEPQVDLEAAPF